MAHTPGPWFVFGNGHCVGGPCEPGNGLLDDPEQKTAGVAMCGMRLRTSEECEANAKLIAAAPDLLALAKEAKNAMAGSHGPCKNNSCSDCRATFLKLKAVIAKAESPSIV
jgi:hypothetical protein